MRPVAGEQIEVSVSVVVAEGGRELGDSVRQATARRDVGEGPVAAVPVDRRGAPFDRTHDEVEPAVPVDVSEHRAGRLRRRTRDSGGGTDLLERAVAAVPEEEVRSDRAARHVDVGKAVAIVISGGDAGREEAGLGFEVARRGSGESVRVREAGIRGDVGEVPLFTRGASGALERDER